VHQGVRPLRSPRRRLAWWLVAALSVVVLALVLGIIPTPSVRSVRHDVPPFGTSSGPPGVAAPDLPFCKVPK
jgi:hypothetical protein